MTLESLADRAAAKRHAEIMKYIDRITAEADDCLLAHQADGGARWDIVGDLGRLADGLAALLGDVE